jgi:hypothetical protein
MNKSIAEYRIYLLEKKLKKKLLRKSKRKQHKEEIKLLKERFFI